MLRFALMSEVSSDAPSPDDTPTLPDVVREIWAARGLASDPTRDSIRATVLVRAVAGVLRSAAMQGVDMLDDPRLEEDLMDLIRSLFRLTRGPAKAAAAG